MKFISFGILCFFVTIISTIPLSAEHSNLSTEYQNFISRRVRSFSSYNSLDENDIKELEKHDVDKDFYLFFEAFVGSDFTNYMSTSEGSIIINEESKVPILLDGSIENKLIVLIGDTQYAIKQEDNLFGSNLLLEHHNGKKMYLHEETFNNAPVSNENHNPMANVRSGAYWRSPSGPVRGKTGSWLAVLSLALEAVGWVGKFKHPVVGTIFKAVGSAVTVGSLVYVTLYTETYQSQRSDCRTYIRQQTLYYKHSNYSGYQKTRFSFFHSVRPDYAGGSCRKY